VSRARRLLIVSGLVLALWGMCYGLLYAVLSEHQALEAMGGSLQTAFTSAAERRMSDAHSAIASYAATKFNYVREVDVHSHWIGLAMVLIALGVVFDRVAFPARVRVWIAASLAIGSAIFPLGVILQTARIGRVASGMAVAGTALVTLGLAAVALGFARRPTSAA